MFSLKQRFFKPCKAVCASMFSLTFLLLFIMYLAPVNRAYCFEVSLAWDANAEADLAGYRIFYRSEGQNYNYSNPAWEGTTTSCKVTSKDPDDTTTYYFVARAHDVYGNESENSNQLSYKQEIVKDHDGDGVWDDEDAFPDDPNEWVDTDGDGIGDNGDTDEVAIVEEVIPDTSAVEDTDIEDDIIDNKDDLSTSSTTAVSSSSDSSSSTSNWFNWFQRNDSDATQSASVSTSSSDEGAPQDMESGDDTGISNTDPIEYKDEVATDKETAIPEMAAVGDAGISDKNDIADDAADLTTLGTSAVSSSAASSRPTSQGSGSTQSASVSGSSFSSGTGGGSGSTQSASVGGSSFSSGTGGGSGSTQSASAGGSSFSSGTGGGSGSTSSSGSKSQGSGSMQSAASVGFSSFENISPNMTAADDTDEVATDEKGSPDMAAAEDTGISDTDTISETSLSTGEYGATVQLYDAEKIDPGEITYYDINGNKIEKAEYKKVTHRRRIRIPKITEEGYQDNTNRLEEPALLREKRIEQWKLLRERRVEQWKSRKKSIKY